MDLLGRNIFWAFLAELLFVILALVLKEDKRKVVTILTMGTIISGIIGFGGRIIDGLTNIPILQPEPSYSLSNASNNAASEVDNPISIKELKNLTFSDPSYQDSAFLDITLKNNSGISHSVGIRFWYEESSADGTRWIVFDRVIENVSGLSSTTSRIVFMPGSAATSSLSGDKLQAVITSIDNQVIYNSDVAFNAISVDLLSSTHEQDGNFITLTCTFNVTNRLPVPLSADDTGTYNYSYIDQGQQIYESYGGEPAPRWDSENYWGSGENYMGFITIPPSGTTQIVLTMGQSLERYVLKSMEISEVTIEINDQSIVDWITISHVYKVSGCTWIN